MEQIIKVLRILNKNKKKQPRTQFPMKTYFTNDIKKLKEFISSRCALPEKVKECPSGRMKMTPDRYMDLHK